MAKLDTGTIEISQWVIHEIPKSFRFGPEATLDLSEALSPFDSEVARFFERKMSDSFARSRHEVDAIDSGETPLKIAGRLSGSSDLVTLSKDLASKLANAQTGAMSSGLLVVMEGSHGSDPLLAVMKLEKEEGARAASAEVDGKATYSVEYLKDLFLTGRTRVFKVAVFVSRDEAIWAGWISDPQSKGSNVADFFVETFLECRLSNDPTIATKRFHEEAERFVNDHVTDAEKKYRYETALVAELNRSDAEVNLAKFATANLDAEDRQHFVDALRDAGLESSFVKDTGLISSKIKRLQYVFESGVKVSHPVDTPPDVVSVVDASAGRTEIRVVDDLKTVHSRA